MKVKRPHTRETLAANLRAMMALREWNQVELANKSGVSQRMISHVLTKNAACSIETADALARPFGLHGWHLLIPNLPVELMQSGSLQRLVEAYTSASADSRDLVDRLLALRNKASNSDS